MRIRQGCWAEFHILCLVPNAPDYRYLAIILDILGREFFEVLPITSISGNVKI